jgi:hypothetical protein
MGFISIIGVLEHTYLQFPADSLIPDGEIVITFQTESLVLISLLESYDCIQYALFDAVTSVIR